MHKKIKNFEELPKDLQEFWNKYAENNQKFIANGEKMMANGCPWCKKKYDRLPQMEAHIKQSHGVPPELLGEMMGYVHINQWK